MRVFAFEEAGIGGGSANEDDGIRLVAADGKDEVGEFGSDVGAPGVELGFSEAFNGGVVDRFRRFFVEGEEIK